MSKNTHFTGQPLYTQLLSLINKAQIKTLSKSGGYDRYVKKLDGYAHLVIMLYGVLMHYDFLRELVLGMLSEAHKLQHLGIDYMVKRSTLSEANLRRDSDFFARIYFKLYEQYENVLPDSRTGRSWEHLLHIMDFTTISLFSNVLKGAGRHPKQGKKKEVLKFTLLFVQMKAFLMIFTLALLLLTTTYYYANSSYLMEHLWRWIEPILTIVYLSN